MWGSRSRRDQQPARQWGGGGGGGERGVLSMTSHIRSMDEACHRLGVKGQIKGGWRGEGSDVGERRSPASISAAGPT